ncbi:class I SAM-dependent DNA methyltransferase [Thiopseudomonas alkaliphila]|uniref:site-specific DNA-methyltransferase (adenine-specific) n=1 Tax=Thiopseudomonas alkaliphila TaxID=1697053 RepID=A0AAW7DP95_9GAMM|nr:DNA methyltransferase [Thiopseudomonas alkaliphila]MDM1695989.1 class I SAM-dependent DNA methyltransferase [Thiopseudomonas alkaliphila]
MNAVEIEAALSELATQPFDAQEFAYEFLAAFGHKETTLKRLRSGNTNSSDVPNGVLLRNNIHIAVCTENTVTETLTALAQSSATSKAKAKFILATDGVTLEAEDLNSGETLACDYVKVADHFGVFLPLAGISTLQEIKDNPIDVRATGRLNKLYVQLLDDNPEWALAERRCDMNHFMARLIFCFFAEDTDIFTGDDLFTKTVDQVSERDGSNTDVVLETIFKAMNIKLADRASAEPRLPSWANRFPYVNGGLFSGSTAVPRFSRMSRTYLMHAGKLNWKQINPDIFGSMIQAVADDAERGALGMHYTSVPNILKVLNPLFLDELREQLAEAGDNPRKLLNLRKRMSCIRVFDPACGSGNFLVIAYKQMRAIEAEINRLRGEIQLKSVIPLTNFRGIEINDFPAEIARLALIIAEYQCDVQYRGQQDALAEFLPLSKENWIICGNALRLDWLSICPPTGTGVKVLGDDLFNTPVDQTEIDFANEGGETYICGNPPYIGSTWQSDEQKDDLKAIFDKRTKTWKSLDYVAGWFMKAADYGVQSNAAAAFVSTNSICQGQQVPILWPLIFATGHEIAFAHTSFKWANLASHNAGVTVVIVGIAKNAGAERRLFSEKNSDSSGSSLEVKKTSHINAYLIPSANVIVEKSARPISEQGQMDFGSKPVDGGNFFLNFAEKNQLLKNAPQANKFIREYSNSDEFINGKQRYCLWLEDSDLDNAMQIPEIKQRINNVRNMRFASKKKQTQLEANTPHKFSEIRHQSSKTTLVVPRVSSENRPFLPVGIVEGATIIGDRNFALYDAPLWNMAIIASRLHWVWVGTVCVRMRTDFSYSNTLGWNTFPVPLLTEQNKADLTACAENILLAREAHFPATIADLYDPEKMPDNLRRAHEQNDEVLERIFIGRRFKNDTERLEKLFDLYTKMIVTEKTKSTRSKKA